MYTNSFNERMGHDNIMYDSRRSGYGYGVNEHNNNDRDNSFCCTCWECQNRRRFESFEEGFNKDFINNENSKNHNNNLNYENGAVSRFYQINGLGCFENGENEWRKNDNREVNHNGWNEHGWNDRGKDNRNSKCDEGHKWEWENDCRRPRECKEKEEHNKNHCKQNNCCLCDFFRIC